MRVSATSVAPQPVRRQAPLRWATTGPCGQGIPHPQPATDRTPWLIAAVAIVAIIVAVAWSAQKRAEPTVPVMSNAGNGGNASGGNLPPGGVVQAPSIENLTPKERFIKLQTKIDQQLEQHDTTRIA